MNLNRPQQLSTAACKLDSSRQKLASSTVSTALDSLDSDGGWSHPRQSRQCCQAVKRDTAATVVDNPSTVVDTYRQSRQSRQPGLRAGDGYDRR